MARLAAEKTMMPKTNIFLFIFLAGWLLSSCGSAPSAQTADNACPDSLEEAVAEPPHALSCECQKALELYQSFLLGETAYYDEDMGMDTTIAPAPSSAYTLFDINGDGLPELVTLGVVRQYRDRSFEIVSTFTGGGIYSYKDGAITLWYDCLTHPFEILQNRTLLFQYDHGDGGYYFDYIELDSAGCVTGETHGVKLTYWEKADAQWKYYLNEEEVCADAWNDRLMSYEALRCDTISWNPYTIPSAD